MIKIAVLLVLTSWLVGTDQDPRSQVVLESDCMTEASRRQITLFANGTVRMRDGLGATRTMRLVELGDVELRAYQNRLRDIRFDDLAPHSSGMEGSLVERCKVEVAPPESETLLFEYGQFDTIPLGLKHVLLLIEDLVVEFESVREAREASESWLHEYNHERPHGSLGGLTPSLFFEQGKPQEREAA